MMILLFILLHWPVGVVEVYKPSNWDGEAGESGVQGHLWLHSDFKASLGYRNIDIKLLLCESPTTDLSGDPRKPEDKDKSILSCLQVYFDIYPPFIWNKDVS